MHFPRHALLPSLLGLAALLPALSCKPRDTASGLRDAGSDYEGYEGANLSPAEERGRRIWYEAAGDNGRFHTYVVAQRLGAPQNWARVLSTATRDERWTKWGLIADPDCKPGDDSTYGFDVCKGDKAADGIAGSGYEGLLSHVGKSGYKDPGCWISGQYVEADCALGLGTSTGALGYRKFPNPRFDAAKWQGWDKYDPTDGSSEPPFLIGTACGSCHITFNPLDPPADPSHPKWRNIKGLVGNQFENMSEVIGSGLNPHSVEWQGGTNVRIGAVDTSAHPTDLVYNPNTVNAIINLDKRPPGLPPFKGDAYRSFDKQITNAQGQKETQRVFNILKGGEDDVGGSGAILRVYINEGLCSEPCWMNHLLDNRSIEGRNSLQTAFDQAQCRADCPAYRALEKFYPDVITFFVSPAGRPTDLKDALFANEPAENRYKKLVASLGEDKVKLGRRVFAKECAQCHSSQKPPEGQEVADYFSDLVAQGERTGQDPFLKEENGVRIDWLGNEEREPVTKIGTIRCRALHSNHQSGHIWDEFSSDTYKNSPTPPGIPELKGIPGGGRGYYRNVSLLSVWTQAPFLHNNAIGPELCNKQHPVAGDCIDKDAIKLDNGQVVNNPSVAGRLKIFDDSMHQLLNPQLRGKKVTRIDTDIVIPIGLQTNVDLGSDLNAIPYLSHFGLLIKLIGGSDLATALNGAKLVIPKGTPVTLLASLDYRRLVKGLMADMVNTPASQRPKKLVDMLNAMFKDPNQLTQKLMAGPSNADPNVYSGYATCTDVIEDKGHEFGAALSDAEKDALITFMKTL